MTRKKLILLLLALGLLLSCAGCGDTPEAEPGADEPEAAVEPEEDSAQKDMEAVWAVPNEVELVPGGSCDIEFSLLIGDKTFTQADAANLTLYTCDLLTATSVEATTNTWVGYKLADILDYLELPSSAFWAIASDGYAMSFEADMVNDSTLVAVSKNGDTTGAPFFAPCVSSNASHYVSDLAEVKLK